MIFDTHAHYDDEQFDGDRESLLESMVENGVGTIVNVCAAYESCERVIAMAEKYPFMYAAVGVHPDEVGSLDEERFSRMKELFKNEKVVAVGEIGLDYYWNNESHDVQKKWFIRQRDRPFFYIQLSTNGKSRYSHVQIHRIDKEVKLIKI